MTSSDQDVLFESCFPKALTGDPVAISLLWKMFAPTIKSYAIRLDSNEFDDIASETWISVSKSMYRFSGSRRDFESFVLSICRRRAIDIWRKSAKFGEGADAIVELPSSEPTPEEAISSQEDLEHVRLLLEVLPKRQRSVVALRCFEDLSFSEIAQLSGTSENTLRVVNHRALGKLAEHLTENEISSQELQKRPVRGGNL